MWHVPHYALEYYLCYVILTPSPHTYFHQFRNEETEAQREKVTSSSLYN